MFEGTSLHEFKAKLAKFQQALGDRTAIEVEQITDVIFKIELSGSRLRPQLESGRMG
jgi:hypothetical protein